MKVLLVNGSPHKNGCTHRALQEIQMQLKKEAIDSEIFWYWKHCPRMYRMLSMSRKRNLCI